MHLYVHVPFCARRCSYCDFAIAVRRRIPSALFASLIEREWAERQNDPAWSTSPRLDTVYFGGGTPSRVAPETIGRLMDRFRADREIDASAEVTLEANPDDVSAEAAARWRAAGVNRISLGAQSFHAGTLAWMHRTHDGDRIGAAVSILRKEGFTNLSLDLIYGVPSSLGRSWTLDLGRALELAPEHFSLYALTVEPHTALGRWTARGEAIPADEGHAADEFLTAHGMLQAAGFEHYEVSNAARPGFRARHNAAYWRRAPFIGLGPSAHSGGANRRAWNVREWEQYRRRVESGATPRLEEETLDDRAIRLEELYLGLRTDLGVDVRRIPATTVELWTREGWAETRQGRIVLTPAGWLRLDALVAATPDS